MDRSTEREAFECYLRTGRRRPLTMAAVEPGSFEKKFNPHHDPQDGRFTFAAGGTRSNVSPAWGGGGFTGGGGGSFGGGGATGRDAWPAPTQSLPPERRKRPDRISTGTTAPGIVVSPRPAVPQTHIVVKNGYIYRLDTADRTTRVTGTLTLAPDRQRSRAAQAKAGGKDRLFTDDGGHYVAVRFNGPTDSFNHFAQDANFNRGGYRGLENKWAKDIKEGEPVYVSITPSYVGPSRRPSTINVVFSVNGQRGFRLFLNTSKGKPHGK